jgi:hypothetical protein
VSAIDGVYVDIVPARISAAIDAFPNAELWPLRDSADTLQYAEFWAAAAPIRYFDPVR